MSKMKYGKRKKLRNGTRCIKDEGKWKDAAARWLERNETRMRKEMEESRQAKLLDATIPWERFDSF